MTSEPVTPREIIRAVIYAGVSSDDPGALADRILLKLTAAGIYTREQVIREGSDATKLRADLKLLVGRIPEEVQDDGTYEAANRIYDFISSSSSSGYTREQVIRAVNAAADAVGPDPDGYEDSDVIARQDQGNLFVNLALGWLDNPGASEDDIILEAYGEDPDTVRGWSGTRAPSPDFYRQFLVTTGEAAALTIFPDGITKGIPEYEVTLSSPEVPEIDPGVREVYDELMNEDED